MPGGEDRGEASATGEGDLWFRWHSGAGGKIDHSLPPSQPVAAALSVEHGKYVAAMCIGCHGATLSGGKIPGGPPDWPAAANITPGDKSVMPAYKGRDHFRDDDEDRQTPLMAAQSK